MAGIANTRCPKCRRGVMLQIGERTGGFSAGKAALGAVLVGPIGIAAGAMGKKKQICQCNMCGYVAEK